MASGSRQIMTQHALPAAVAICPSIILGAFFSLSRHTRSSFRCCCDLSISRASLTTRVRLKDYGLTTRYGFLRQGNESYGAELLGTAGYVAEERVGDDDIIVVGDASKCKAVTMLLRGANDMMLDEMDRSIHDSLCIVQRTLESGMVRNR
eukprot:889694-Prorocentrum_minimum.AAC.4